MKLYKWLPACNGLGATIKYLVNQDAGTGSNWAKAHYTKAGTNSAESPCGVAAFVVNSDFLTGARLSARLCVGPELARCVDGT